MSILNAARRAANVGRRAADRVGVRLTTVTVTTVTYSAPRNTAGATVSSTSTLVLSPRFKVTAGSSAGGTAFGGGGLGESALVLEADEFAIGPITRAYPGGGYTEAQIVPVPTSTSQRVYYLLDDGGDQFNSGGEKFEAVRLDTSAPLHITLVVRRTDQGA